MQTHILEAGIDYYSATMRGDRQEFRSWYANCLRTIEVARDLGNVVKEGKCLGYDGYYCGSAFVGRREDGGYIRLSGTLSSRLWSGIHHPMASVTRLDIQVTLRHGEKPIDYGKQVYDIVNAYNESLPDIKQRKLNQWNGNDGGFTVYIGKRGTGVFCRIYDKEVESKDEFYADSVRYEVELREGYAKDAAAYMYDGGRSQPRASASTCWQVFNDRGLQLDYTRESEENALLPQKAPQTDTERQLKWLATQVRPTIKRLEHLVPYAILHQALYGDTEAALSDAEEHLVEEVTQWAIR